MPSSHSAISFGLFVLLIADAIDRVHPAYASFDSALEARVGANRASIEGVLPGGTRRKVPEAMFEAGARRPRCQAARIWMMSPFASHETLTHMEFTFFLAFWGLLMLPVPFMRVVLYDHSTAQVTAGSAVGGVLAVVWMLLARCLQTLRDSALRSIPFLQHNNARPKFCIHTSIEAPPGEVQMLPRASGRLKDVEERSREVQTAPHAPCRSADVEAASPEELTPPHALSRSTNVEAALEKMQMPPLAPGLSTDVEAASLEVQTPPLAPGRSKDVESASRKVQTTLHAPGPSRGEAMSWEC